MRRYKEKDILRLAKRINNSKRSYLLVNPLQAKHIPVSPSDALQMMTSLGELVSERYGDARLVIGFAETATAIGAVVAKSISDECTFIHTTREKAVGANNYVFFTEEHSHATEQKIVADDLETFFTATDTIVLVDDEFSTGKTLVNMVDQLKDKFPAIRDKKIVAASIINRLSEENLRRWAAASIESVCLLKLDNLDYTASVEPISVKEAVAISEDYRSSDALASIIVQDLPDPRLGVNISYYYEMCTSKAELLSQNCNLQGKDVLILGTEECMLPALLIGKAIEDQKKVHSIMCHATTRSPIGISNIPDYPIQSGYCIHSLYDLTRNTFIYNLRPYDTVLIVSDTKAPFHRGLYELSVALKQQGCGEILCLAGDSDV